MAKSRSLAETQPILLRLVFGACAIIGLSYFFLLVLDPGTAKKIAVEDGPIENLGAVFSLIAACIFLLCYFSKEERNRFFGYSATRNVWFLGLFALMFVSFGEEISWGQRIFGWSTPDRFQDINAQGETNFHNLWLFQAKHPDGTRKSQLALFLNTNRIYAIFWLTYCCVLPFLFQKSTFVQRWSYYSGVPVPPISAGGIFVANFLLFSLIVSVGQLDRAMLSALDELKETNYQLAYVALATCFYARLGPQHVIK